MQMFFVRNIVPITSFALVFSVVSLGDIVGQKSMVCSAYAEEGPAEGTELPNPQPMVNEPRLDEALPSDPEDNSMPLPVPDEPMTEPYPQIGEDSIDPARSNDEIALPTGYDNRPVYIRPLRISSRVSNHQILNTSTEKMMPTLSDGSMNTAEEGETTPPDPTAPGGAGRGKEGKFKGQRELPPVIPMGEEPQEGGLTKVMPSNSGE